MSTTIIEQAAAQRSESRCVSKFFGKRVHFIGIGGCGMSGLARILADAGAVVTGSEPKPNAASLSLVKRGVKIVREQDGHLLDRNIDLVVRTAAVKDDNPEFTYARSLGLPHLKYAQLLGQVMSERLGVAVAGTHGKSTTTGMIAYALTRCGQDHSWVVGGIVPQLSGGSSSGAGTAFVVEACEYDRSFHNLHPSVALVTNIDADHLDCYKDINDIIESFRHFLCLLPPDGTIICNGDDSNVSQAIRGSRCHIQTVGFESFYSWCAESTGIVNGCHTANILNRGQLVGQVQLSVPGIHNLYNATMAIAACAACGVSPTEAARAVSSFTGVDRRMAHIGHYRGAVVVDDYGHHPTEIRATLAALRERYQPKRLYCVFQPHQHSRTRLLFNEFSHAFEQADTTIIPDIYQCRDSEADRKSVTANNLVESIRANGQNALYFPDFPAVVQHLKNNVAQGDLVLTIGAGNVYEIGRELVDAGPTI